MVVVGDFNIEATWPVWFGFAGIPIDHAFVSTDVAITHIETGPNIGSDHRPILGDLAIFEDAADQGSPGTP